MQYDEWTDKQSGAHRHDYKLVGDIEFLAAPRGNSDGREQQVENTVEQESETEQESDPLAPAEAEPVATAAAGNTVGAGL